MELVQAPGPEGVNNHTQRQRANAILASSILENSPGGCKILSVPVFAIIRRFVETGTERCAAQVRGEAGSRCSAILATLFVPVLFVKENCGGY